MTIYDDDEECCVHTKHRCSLMHGCTLSRGRVCDLKIPPSWFYIAVLHSRHTWICQFFQCSMPRLANQPATAIRHRTECLRPLPGWYIWTFEQHISWVELHGYFMDTCEHFWVEVASKPWSRFHSTTTLASPRERSRYDFERTSDLVCVFVLSVRICEI